MAHCFDDGRTTLILGRPALPSLPAMWPDGPWPGRARPSGLVAVLASAEGPARAAWPRRPAGSGPGSGPAPILRTGAGAKLGRGGGGWLSIRALRVRV